MPTLESVEQIAEDVRAQLTPDQQATYLAAYNQAIEAGATPEAAHATALSTATATAAAEDTSNMEPDKEKDKTTAAAKNAAAAAVAAKDAELQTLRAQLAAAKHNENTVSAKLGSLEAEVKTLAAEAASARQEKERLLAEQDVDKAILAGKVAIATRKDAVDVRLKLGPDLFTKFIAGIKATAPVGERGTTHVAAGAASSVAAEAEQDVRRLGVEGVIAAGLHRLQTAHGEAVRGVLAAEHADHPLVQRHVPTKKTGGAN